MAGNFQSDFAEFMSWLAANTNPEVISRVQADINSVYPTGNVGVNSALSLPGLTVRQRAIALQQTRTKIGLLLSKIRVSIQRAAKDGVAVGIGPAIQEAGFRIGILQRSVKTPGYVDGTGGGMGLPLPLLIAGGVAGFFLLNKKARRKWLKM